MVPALGSSGRLNRIDRPTASVHSFAVPVRQAAILGPMTPPPDRRVPYYRDDLALVHHLGFGFHADACAAGILEYLEPVRGRDGLILEIGCGSGLLTRHLVDAGLRVLATDASDAMLQLARSYAPGAIEIRRLCLPDDPLPPADAVVGVGHALNYLDEGSQVDAALVAIAGCLRPGGVMAIDLCDLQWGAARVDQAPKIWKGDDWVLMTEFSVPDPSRFVRTMTTFVRQADGTWRRDDERHDNVLVDTATVPELLARHGVDTTISASFGAEAPTPGLVAVIGRKVG